MSHGYARWVAFVERHHRAILAGSLVLALVSALSLRALRLDLDVLDMLPTGAPAFDNFKQFVGEFGQLDELVVLVTANDENTASAFADVFVPELRRLRSVRTVQGRVDANEVSTGILGRYVYNYLPLAVHDELRRRLSPAGVDAAVAANRAILQAPFDLQAAAWVQRDPLGIAALAGRSLATALGDNRIDVAGGYLRSADGLALLLVVRPVQSPFDIAFTKAFMAEVRAAEAKARAALDFPAALRVGYTGGYAFALEDEATIRWDIAQYTVLALAGVLAVFAAGYRQLRILPCVAYGLVLATLLTFLAALIAYGTLNAVSLSFAALLYGLSIDSAIHYYTRLMQERQRFDLRTAVTRSLGALGSATLLATSTTAAAFAVIGFSNLGGVSQLGTLTAFGMLVNAVEFFVLYPALSFRWPAAMTAPRPLDAPLLGRVALASVRHRRPLLATGIMAVPVLLWLAAGVSFDVDLMHLRPRDSPGLRIEQEIARRFGTRPDTAAVLVRGPDVDSALEHSEAVAAASERLREEGLVGAPLSVTALLPSERTQRERLQAFAALPRHEAAAALRAALPRHGFRPALFDPFLADLVGPHDAIVRPGDPALAAFEPLLQRYVRLRPEEAIVATYLQPAPGVDMTVIEGRLRAVLPATPFVVASRALLEAELGKLLRWELLWFFVAAFGVNFLLVLVRFPRLTAAAAILLPEALVSLALLALMRAADIGIGPVNVIVVPLVLGIGVDHCVYVAERVQRGDSPARAVRHVGRALAVSALTTIAGFGFLALSEYPALAAMGELTAASLLGCLVAAVTLLPATLAVGAANEDTVDGTAS